MNRAMLRSKMALNEDTNNSLATYLGMSPVTFSRKLNEIDGAEFSQREMSQIKQKYALTDDEFMQIFFAEEVS
jgi:hypothetical protein